MIRSYFHSFLQDKPNIRIGVGRAGNVIGGGDWAKDRIVADCMRAWSQNQHVFLRRPAATRPWQHVLEPLSGYLALGSTLAIDGQLDGEAFNFGPIGDQSHTVYKLSTDLAKAWGNENDLVRINAIDQFKESEMLQINCDKARAILHWAPVLPYDHLIQFVNDWYLAYYRQEQDMLKVTQQQIQRYESLAGLKQVEWACNGPSKILNQASLEFK